MLFIKKTLELTVMQCCDGKREKGTALTTHRLEGRILALGPGHHSYISINTSYHSINRTHVNVCPLNVELSKLAHFNLICEFEVDCPAGKNSTVTIKRLKNLLEITVFRTKVTKLQLI